MNGITIQKLLPSDHARIESIAHWYREEWNVPAERTIKRLSTQSPDDIIFHLVLSKDDQPVATGGLYHQVGILMEHEKFRATGPWVALVYTKPENRNQGIGRILLDEIENVSREIGIRKIYLYTFTAETLYLRSGWKPTERIIYHGHDTVVMEKELPGI